MPYILCDENNNCLRQNKNSRYEIVNDISKATKWDKIQKANNVCDNIKLNKKLNTYKLQVKYVIQENKIVKSPAKPIELDYNILDKIKEISAFTKQLEDRRSYLIEKIQEIDLNVVDVEHAAEFYSLNASQGYKLYKLLHDLKTERRKYKNELEKIELTLKTYFKSQSIENLEKSILGIDTKKYTPRINRDLFM